MPVSVSSVGSASTREPDTLSLLSQATSTMTIGDSLPVQLVRKTSKKGFTFNIMAIGPPGIGKTTILSALFNKNLDISKDNVQTLKQDPLNPRVEIHSKTFELEDKGVRIRLTVAESDEYGEALCLPDSHEPLVKFIDRQFADYHRRESSYDRRKIQDKMIHCLLFFISPYGHGLTKLDIELLKAVHGRVNIIPIIAKAETLTVAERVIFKRRIKDDFKKNDIDVYRMSDPDINDPDDLKKAYKDIQDAMPFAVTSMSLRPDNTIVDRQLDWGQIDSNDLNHSEFLLLKMMLHMQMPDLCEITHEVFYEEYRLKFLETEKL